MTKPNVEYGTNDNDYLDFVYADFDALKAKGGDDTISVYDAPSGYCTIYGGPGDDVISFGAGIAVNPGSGSDWLDPLEGAGTNTIIGFTTKDRIYLGDLDRERILIDNDGNAGVYHVVVTAADLSYVNGTLHVQTDLGDRAFEGLGDSILLPDGSINLEVVLLGVNHYEEGGNLLAGQS